MSQVVAKRSCLFKQPHTNLAAFQVVAELSCLENLVELTMRGWTRGPVVTLAALAPLRALTSLQIAFLEDGPVRHDTLSSTALSPCADMMR